jgi:hypothetical protein
VRCLIAIIVSCGTTILTAQSPSPTFDVVSIKKSDPDARGGGGRTMPDGTTVITNNPFA